MAKTDEQDGDRDALGREALRIAERYAVEVVEAFDICPWAKPSRLSGTQLRRVMFNTAVDAGAQRETLEQIELFACDFEHEIALLIFPLLEVDRPMFRKFVSALEFAHGEAHHGSVIPVAMATFHPSAAANLASPDKLINFLRCSPDPTVQLVRRSSLSAARKATDEGSGFVAGLAAIQAMRGARPKQSVSERVAAQNLATVERIGVATVEAVLKDIANDRQKSYAAAIPSARRKKR